MVSGIGECPHHTTDHITSLVASGGLPKRTTVIRIPSPPRRYTDIEVYCGMFHPKQYYLDVGYIYRDMSW